MAYNTLEIIVSGYALDQLSRGCYMPITASNQGYILYIYIYIYLFIYLYHGAWAIAMVTFDVLREIYAHNLPVDREI